MRNAIDIVPRRNGSSPTSSRRIREMAGANNHTAEAQLGSQRMVVTSKTTTVSLANTRAKAILDRATTAPFTQTAGD